MKVEEDSNEINNETKRMKQVFIVGGNHEHPSDFSRIVNKNIKILMESDRNAEIQDIKFSVQKDPRYIEYGMVYLAFIIAEVDIIDKQSPPEIEGSNKHKKKKRKKRRR